MVIKFCITMEGKSWSLFRHVCRSPPNSTARRATWRSRLRHRRVDKRKANGCWRSPPVWSPYGRWCTACWVRRAARATCRCTVEVAMWAIHCHTWCFTTSRTRAAGAVRQSSWPAVPVTWSLTATRATTVRKPSWSAVWRMRGVISRKPGGCSQMPSFFNTAKRQYFRLSQSSVKNKTPTRNPVKKLSNVAGLTLYLEIRFSDVYFSLRYEF